MTIRRRLALPVLTSAASVTLAVAGAVGTAGSALAAPATHQAPASVHRGYTIEPGRLYHVAGTSASNLWAVGLGSNSSLIEHWNGHVWSLSSINPLGFYYGVAATAASNAWAVGGTNWGSPSQTLIDHWNGRTWTRVHSPTPSGTAVLTAVTATSATNAWAAGYIGGGPGDPGITMPIMLHWNGKTWTQQTVHEPPNGGQFLAVSATSASNAWAVGFWSNTSNGALIEHWNGKKWASLVTHAPRGADLLSGVTAISPDDVWAVGFSDATGTDQPLIEHWNGSIWHAVKSPNPTGSTNLWAVSASSASNVWAAGYTNPSSCSPSCGTAAFHFNGQNWQAVPSPDPPAAFLNAFLGVIAVSGKNAWAVGSTDWSTTLISHWNGKSWK